MRPRRRGSFTWQIWVTVLGGLIFSAAVMFAFEASAGGLDGESEDFGGPELHAVARIALGLYRAVSNFTATGGFSPSTPAGHAFNCVFSFCVLLLQAAYTANLAAYFTRSVAPVQLITSMQSFAQVNAPVCVPNDSFIASLLQAHFPGTTYVNFPQGRVRSAAQHSLSHAPWGS